MRTSRRLVVVSCFVLALIFSAFPPSSFADVELVSIEAPTKEAWIGQRVSFSVKLRGKGPFVGASSFSLPQIPRTVIVKIGSPVVSSEEIEDDSWFVQTHEFAIFSQATGSVEIPPFEVRFTNRDGFTGPEIGQVQQVPALTLTIKRPPNSEQFGFLVTTKEIDINETWNPTPGPATQGAVFRRVISQEADEMTGMALAPPPTKAPPGIRVYTDHPEVSDNTERGAFRGTCRDRITYYLQEPGTLTIPAIKYVWWNPESEEFGSKTLPAVTFEIAALPQTDNAGKNAAEGNRSLLVMAVIVLALGSAILLLFFWQRERIAHSLQATWEVLNPPDRVAAKKLLAACRTNDPHSAEAAWASWRGTQSSVYTPTTELATSVLELQRHLYGSGDSTSWKGESLAKAFNHDRHRTMAPVRPSVLPELNPNSR
ncbi:Oxygen tolerance [Planctomycetales bacterium 10988]|nr:Oxygen tolerance [Planctomycetales bacterium 10988]